MSFPEKALPVLPERWTGAGLVDLQVNGVAGVDFNAPAEKWKIEDWRRAREALRKRGIVAALVTFITDDLEALYRRVARYREFVEADATLATMFPGLHIEGPFVSPEDGPRGAHPKTHCRAPAEAPDFLERLIAAAGGTRSLKILTLAPELSGAMALIAEASRRGMVVALGHTNADAATIDLAVRAGAVMATHLGNGSHEIMPRSENYIQNQLADDRLAASFIADGHHIPFPTLKNMLRAKGFERAILVSDSVAAAGMPPGRYCLGDEEVVLDETGKVAKPGQPNLAGSALTLDRAVLLTARHGDVPFEVAWAMASTQAARLVGMDPEWVTVRVESDGFVRELTA